MRFSGLGLGCVAAMVVVSAQAGPIWSLSVGAYSTQTGALHETFDAAAVNPSDTLTLGFTGGTLMTGSLASIYLQPVGSTGNYLTVGTDPVAQLGPIEIDLSALPATYYGFLWGTPDAYNTVAFYDGATLLMQLSGAEVFADPATEGRVNPVYFNFHAGVGEKITRVVLNSSQNAFETDNHAILPVTAPGTHALTLAALGLLIAFRPVRKVR
jgi:hypothetical protein